MHDPALHKQASKGYKYTGTNVALDGSEDWRICREAGEFWQELQMRPKVNAAVAEVKAAFDRGELPWTYANVQSLITPYPKRGHLDVLKYGQDDEAPADPDGVPWETAHNSEGAPVESPEQAATGDREAQEDDDQEDGHEENGWEKEGDQDEATGYQ